MTKLERVTWKTISEVELSRGERRKILRFARTRGMAHALPLLRFLVEQRVWVLEGKPVAVIEPVEFGR